MSPCPYAPPSREGKVELIWMQNPKKCQKGQEKNRNREVAELQEHLEAGESKGGVLGQGIPSREKFTGTANVLNMSTLLLNHCRK